MIQYSLRPYSKEAGFIEITLRLRSTQPVTQFALPYWRPGRYSAQNYAANVRDVCCWDETGSFYPIQKSDPNTWVVKGTPDTDITLQYLYFARQADAGGNWYDSELLYINPVACCMMVKDQMDDICSLHLELPPTYKLASGASATDTTTFEFENYLHLSDTPFIASPNLTTLSYEVGGTLFYLNFNEPPTLDIPQLIKHFQLFTDALWKDFNTFPFDSYHFLFLLFSFPHYHGVEHRNSTVICLGPAQELSESLYTELLGISCHELLHAWNVYSIRPKELYPYDLLRPTLYSTGFVTEGFTTYLGDYYLYRSGVLTIEMYKKELNTLLLRHFRNFGYDHLSVEDSSIDLWVDGYDSGIPHRKVSIYVKGAIIALLMDYWIQRHNATASLRSLLIDLWNQRKGHIISYTMTEIEHLFLQYSACSSTDFRRLVSQTGNVKDELYAAFHYWGYSLQDVFPENIWMKKVGIQCDTQGKVLQCDPQAPAAQYLTKGDVIQLVNGKIWKDVDPALILAYKPLTVEYFNGRIIQTIRLEVSKEDYFGILQLT